VGKKPTTPEVDPAATSEVDVQAVTDAAFEAGTFGAATVSFEPTRSTPATENIDELRKKAAERDEFLGLLQHVRADFANYQKRIQKELEGTRRFASQSFIADLLPVVDNLERAIQSTGPSAAPNGLLDGIRLVHQQLQGVLARHGVQPIAADGLAFDPSAHEAVLEQPCSDKPERTVLQVLEKGYTLHDRVIRPAKVIVSKPASPDNAA
jgi:molecular chaperone GrpE